MKGWMYILECCDGTYYTGSTNDLALRLVQHQNGEGANHTRKRLPVSLVYYEEFDRIDEAFNREKQVQGWSRKKKEALIHGQSIDLHKLSECTNKTHFRFFIKGGFGSPQPPDESGFGSPQPPFSKSDRCLSGVEGSREGVPSATLRDRSQPPDESGNRCLSGVEGSNNKTKEMY